MSFLTRRAGILLLLMLAVLVALPCGAAEGSCLHARCTGPGSTTSRRRVMRILAGIWRDAVRPSRLASSGSFVGEVARGGGRAALLREAAVLRI